jgi:hypothetical protein
MEAELIEYSLKFKFYGIYQGIYEPMDILAYISQIVNEIWLT